MRLHIRCCLGLFLRERVHPRTFTPRTFSTALAHLSSARSRFPDSRETPADPSIGGAPRRHHQVRSVIAETMPSRWLAHVVRKENRDRRLQVDFLCQRPCHKPWAGGIGRNELATKRPRNIAVYRRCPGRVLKPADAIAYYSQYEWVPRFGPESEIADFPIPVMLVAEVPANREFFEWENARVLSQWLEAARKVDVEIKIEPPQPVNRQISKKVESLDGQRETGISLLILFWLVFKKTSDPRIIEEAVLIVRMKQRCAYRCGSTLERKFTAGYNARLRSTVRRTPHVDETFWNSSHSQLMALHVQRATVPFGAPGSRG